MKPPTALVVMGVAGCGKSTLGQAVGERLGWPVIEGDDFHPPRNRELMSAGVALTDDDRRGWLDALAGELAAHPQGVVLTCSALKRAYRERLRQASPGLRFAHLRLARADAERRVASRAEHLFPSSLVASQFEALESPAGEAGVLEVDAMADLPTLVQQVCDWLEARP